MGKYISLIIAVIIIVTFTFYFSQTYGQKIFRDGPFNLSPDDPRVFDSRLKVEQVVDE